MHGALVALTTPFTADGSVDLDALGRHVERLVADGIDGVMPCGTTGEGALLEDDEVVAVTRRVVEAAAGAVPVVAHVGRPGTAATLRLAEAALATGADAVSAVVPYYFPLPGERIVAHYEVLAGGLAGAPLLVYVIPSHALNDLGAGDFETLLRAGVAGLKDSTKSLQRHREYVAAARASERVDAAVLVGSDTLLVEARRSGGSGSVTAMGNLMPAELSALQRAADIGDWDEAERLQGLVVDARAQLGPGGTARATKRAIAAWLGDYPDHVRAPL